MEAEADNRLSLIFPFTLGTIKREVKRLAAEFVGKARAMERDDQSPAGSRANDVDLVVSSGQVVQIVALVKPFRAQAVLAALESVKILGGTIREAMGYGRQKDRLHQYLGSEYNSSFLPKVELTLFVEAEHAHEAIKAIVSQARTGRIGDGKILVLPCFGEYLSW